MAEQLPSNELAARVLEIYGPTLRRRRDGTHFEHCWQDHWSCALDMCLTEIGRLQQELVEREASFDLRWKASQRAIKRWQEAHPGNDLVWPDHADLCVWLLEQLDARGADEPSAAELLQQLREDLAREANSRVVLLVEIEHLRKRLNTTTRAYRQVVGLECTVVGCTAPMPHFHGAQELMHGVDVNVGARALRECMASGYDLHVDEIDAKRLVRIILREGRMGIEQQGTAE